MLMLWRLLDDGLLDLSVLNGYDSYLWGLAEVGPQHSLVSRNGDFLILFHYIPTNTISFIICVLTIISCSLDMESINPYS